MNLPGKTVPDAMSQLEAIGPAKLGEDSLAGRQNLPEKTKDSVGLPNPPSWAKARLAAEREDGVAADLGCLQDDPVSGLALAMIKS